MLFRAEVHGLTRNVSEIKARRSHGLSWPVKVTAAEGLAENDLVLPPHYSPTSAGH